MKFVSKEDVFEIDEAMYDWSDLEPKIVFEKWGLLYGNGLSMAFYNEGFSYKYLSDRVKQKDHEVKVLLEEIVKNNNLEGLLLKLSDTKEVVSQVSDARCPPAAEALTEKYKSIQGSFIETVKDLHPDSMFKMDISRLKSFILKFKWVFTTNYDLLTYWSIVHDIPFKSPASSYDGFTDFFYKSNGSPYPYYHDECEFLKKPKRTNIYYLHGALHIFNSEYNKAIKISPDENSTLLQSIEYAMESGDVPIFVSEGDSQRKEMRIQGNPYLNYCYRQLKNESIRNMLIFGQSLADNDAHLFNAIMQNGYITDIWYGVFIPEIDRLDEDAIQRYISSEAEGLKNRAANALNRHGNSYLPRKVKMHFFIANRLSTWLTS